MAELKKANLFLKTNIFKGHNRHKTSRGGLDCNSSGSQLGLIQIKPSQETAK